MDASAEIELMISALAQTLWQGAGLAMLIVLVFLRRWRATLIIALAIPFSLLLAIVGMFFLDFTINMMSLFGLIIAVGMIVDNAIVILENVTRHRETGERPNEASTYGASEVGMAVAASTLTTVCIFFPVLFVKGVSRIIFVQFAVVASIAMLGSLFSAVTLVPMLSAVLLRAERSFGASPNRLFRASEGCFVALESFYARLLGWALHHRKTVMGGATAVFAASLLLVPRLGSEFMPRQDQNTVRGTLHMPVGTRVEVTREVMRRVDELMRQEIRPEERIATFTKCGTSGGMGAVMSSEGAHIGSFSIRLVASDKRARSDQEIAAGLRRELQGLQHALSIDKFNVDTSDMMAGMILGGERPLTVNILGDDLEETDRLAAEIRQIATGTPGAVGISISREKARPELQIVVDRARAARSGLNTSAIGDTARTSFYGQKSSKYRIHGDEYDVFVRLRDADRNEPADVAAMPVRLPGGSLIRVDNVADVRQEFGPVTVDRKDQTRVVNVTGDVFGRALGAVVGDIEAELPKLSVPPGIEVKMAGQTEDMRDSFLWLSLALIIGLILVYMVMASQFESLIDPFVVMFSIPFAFTGVIWALWARGYHLNIIVFLGMLMLVGTVVNNAIVLVDYIGILRARGQSMLDAVRNAGRTRLRPVLMTALTTIVALIPMAFRSGQSAEVWNQLGTTVAVGLLVSTMVTLILVPTMYSLFEQGKKKSG
jgi:HAE1 family hydrophobic/amphiphilic exporter-1